MAGVGGFFFLEVEPEGEGAVSVGAADGEDVEEAHAGIGEGEDVGPGGDEEEEEVGGRSGEGDSDVFGRRASFADGEEAFPAEADLFDADSEEERGGNVTQLMEGHGKEAVGDSAKEGVEPVEELEHDVLHYDAPEGAPRRRKFVIGCSRKERARGAGSSFHGAGRC